MYLSYMTKNGQNVVQLKITYLLIIINKRSMSLILIILSIVVFLAPISGLLRLSISVALIIWGNFY